MKHAFSGLLRGSNNNTFKSSLLSYLLYLLTFHFFNQVYVASVSPARDESAGYVAWGHTTVVNPWGEVIARADSGEETILVDLDLVH